MELQTILETLCTAPGIPGQEAGVAAQAAKLLEPLGSVETTPLGSLICRVHPWQEGRPTLMLEAHFDQVGLVVTAVCEGGFVRVSNCGGVDTRLLPGCAFLIHTAGGPIPAVGVAVPPHLQTDATKDKPQKLEDMLLDTGLSHKEALETIRPGDAITYDAPARALAGGFFTAPALDDRAGCAAIIAAAQQLQGKDYGLNCALVLSSMEEVGGQGAKTAAYILQPKCCIAVDVTFGDAPGLPEQKCFALGSGVQLGAAAILNRALTTRLEALAKVRGIPYGVEVMGGKTGTDADQIAITCQGVTTALLSIPLRNMHTPSELILIKDIEATAALLAAAIEEGCVC